MGKICSKCKVEKDESEFYSNKRMPDGLDYYCKDCRKGTNLAERTQEYTEDNQAFIESLKTECCKCGEDRPWLIQFHHVIPENKSFNVTCGTRSKASIWNEISKCVCLCANCHTEFHHFFGKRPINPAEALDTYLTDIRY